MLLLDEFILHPFILYPLSLYPSKTQKSKDLEKKICFSHTKSHSLYIKCYNIVK